MQKVVGVSFKISGKVYNFDPQNLFVKTGDSVIVETEKGLQYGFIASEIEEIDEKDLVSELKPIVRFATKEDKKTHDKNVKDAIKAMDKAQEFIDELELDMHLIDASFTFDRKQLLFNFLADDRVDFRELAKKLAQVYRTRIELRQIGVRDKAREIGGLGPCGRIICCNSFLNDINSVTINMAKNQFLALNPTKINGVCGRLLCCLGYEDETYTALRKNMPAIGSRYSNKDVSGKVVDIDIFKRTIQVEVDENNIVEVSL